MDSRKLTILILHAAGDLSTARPTLVDFITGFHRHAPEHDYVIHEIDSTVTRALKRIRFDVILLDSTFLDARLVRPIEILDGIRRRYDFVRTSDAIKIALPQDEYDNGGLLDAWLADWNIDILIACGVHDHWDVVFPRTMRIAEMRKGVTGFFDPVRAKHYRDRYPPLAARPIDVGYRVSRLPPEFGSYGQIKADLADVFTRALEPTSLVADISTESSRMIMGEAWWDFLGSCKFALASESGSGIWDPHGEIRVRAARYRDAHPDAGFAEVRDACLADIDGKYVFRMISPRVFEATSTMTSQVLVRGNYLGLLREWEHFIPVAEDFSDVDDAIEALRDIPAAARRAEACFETLVHSPQIHYPTFVRATLGRAAEKVAERGLRGMDPDELRALRAEHERVSWSEQAKRAGLRVLKRFAPQLKRIVPRRLQAHILARMGRRIGLR